MQPSLRFRSALFAALLGTTLATAAGVQAQTGSVAPNTNEGEHDAIDMGEMKRSAIPPGSYQRSCKDSHVRGSTLYSTCRRANGKWHKTKLDNYPECGADDIYNRDGNLACVIPG